MQAVYYLYAIVWIRRVEIQQHHKSENVIKPTGRELPAALAVADQSALFARLCCNKSIYQFIFSLHMKSEGWAVLAQTVRIRNECVCVLLVYGMHCLSFMTNDNKPTAKAFILAHFLLLPWAVAKGICEAAKRLPRIGTLQRLSAHFTDTYRLSVLSMGLN